MSTTEKLILKLIARLARAIATGNQSKIQTVAGSVYDDAEKAMIK